MSQRRFHERYLISFVVNNLTYGFLDSEHIGYLLLRVFEFFLFPVSKEHFYTTYCTNEKKKKEKKWDLSQGFKSSWFIE